MRLSLRRIIFAYCLAVAFAFGLLPWLYSAKAATTEIVTLKQAAEYGTVITGNVLTITEVGSYGLPDSVVRDKSEIIGLVAMETFHAGEYLWRGSFISTADYEGVESKTGYGLSENLPAVHRPAVRIMDAGGHALHDGQRSRGHQWQRVRRLVYPSYEIKSSPG